MNVIQNFKLRDIWDKSFYRFHRLLSYWIQGTYGNRFEEDWCFRIEYDDELGNLKSEDLEAMINIILEEEIDDIYIKINEYSSNKIYVYSNINNELLLTI